MYFADIDVAVETAGFSNTTFADDMNAWRPLDHGLDPNVHGKSLLLQVQEEVHAYGAANQMKFDSRRDNAFPALRSGIQL